CRGSRLQHGDPARAGLGPAQPGLNVLPPLRYKLRREKRENVMADAIVADYIIVGPGSAGCVLANRLTADGRNKVLLLEAGGDDRRLWIHIPLGYGKLFADPRGNWLYKTQPQPQLARRQVRQPRGKALGRPRS